ncbi:MAG: efflux transporter outer membrane subunit [Gammaproteobacteria bacterium]|nr:efflux transporter outer membrane subunit [Gammaproteobacteria bacterium]
MKNMDTRQYSLRTTPFIKHKRFRCVCIFLVFGILSSCGSKRDIIDLSPEYNPPKLIVPRDWRGESPFKLASPKDNTYNGKWWKIFHDPVLNQLQEKFHESNPTLQAAAERFIQSRYEMMKARSMYLPQLGIKGFYDKNQRSLDELQHGEVNEFAFGNTASFLGPLSWEPDIFSRYRNETNVRVFQAQASAAHYGAIRLLLQTELAADYYILRALDAKNAVYLKSIAYYKKSLNLVTIQFKGKLASKIDVMRAKFLLAGTESKQLEVEAERQVVEQSIAALLNISPSTFKIKPVSTLTVPQITIPNVLPAELLERRPDIADLERKMAQANKSIGIARAAFFPQINLNGSSSLFLLTQISNPVWALGTILNYNVFEAGFRRAQLQKSWSIYRQTLNDYREGILTAFKEVEHGLSKTNLIDKSLGRQKEAVDAAFQTQELTMDLFRGKLASSLDLLYAELNTLEARIHEVEIKQNLMVATVYLVKALGGGWNQRTQLPQDEQIPAFGLFQYNKLGQIEPVVGIKKSEPENQVNLIGGH